MSHQLATIKMHAGESLPIAVTVTDNGAASGTPVDLTDADPVVFLVALGFGGIPIIEKDLVDGVVLTNPAAGICTATLEPEDTAALAGIYTYTVRATLADNSAIVPLTGRLLIERTSTPVVP